VKTPRFIANHRPVIGSAAFVRGMASQPFAYVQADRLGKTASHWKLDRDEDRHHPGEASA
jgi:hypothetical protein